MIDQATSEPDKIILIGLAESGKTTITNVITDGFVPDKNASYKATVDYKRREIILLGKKMTIFDLGGQKVFLDRFTGDMAQFIFSKVKALVFTVDSEKVETFSQVKHYLDLAVKNLDQYSPEAPIYVLLHKNDLIDSDKREELAKHTKTYLKATLHKPIKFFETSVFSESIFHAFGNIFAEITGIHDSLKNILDNFVKENSQALDSIQLFYPNGVPLLDPSYFGNVSLSHVKSIIESFILSIGKKKEDTRSAFIESENNVYFVRFLENDAVLFLHFTHFGIYMNHESVPVIYNKVALLADELNSYYSNY
ncbi:MAG: ADP-ribosylation factor-like protein [Candidatus Odinarchaeota archaeon]